MASLCSRCLLPLLLVIVVRHFTGGYSASLAHTTSSSLTFPLHTTELQGRRIVGGHSAARGRFSYVVALTRKDSHEVLCGGVVYDARHVLTAAHCFDDSDSPSTTRVLAGVVNKADLSDPHRSEFDILREFKHDLFHNNEKHDISIIRVNGSFSMKILIARPSIRAPNSLTPHSICTLAGWGTTVPHVGDNESRNEDVYPDVMNYVSFPLIPIGKCQELYWNIQLTPESFCAGDLAGEKDGCLGDSGSPLVCGGHLVGLMSAGSGCAKPRLPGVYLNISHYHSWIDSTVRRSYEEENANLHEQQKQPRYMG